MKDYILSPARVVDLKRIPHLDKITANADGLRLGALVTITQVVHQDRDVVALAGEVAHPSR